MDKLTSVRIKGANGYSAEIPFTTAAEHVQWDSLYTLVDILGNVRIDDKGSVQTQLDTKTKTITGTDDPSANIGENGNLYFQIDENNEVQKHYIKIDDVWAPIDVIRAGAGVEETTLYLDIPYTNVGEGLVYFGTEDPDASFGNDGALYFKIVNGTVVASYVKQDSTWKDYGRKEINSGTAQPTGTAADNTLYIQYDANDGAVVALWVYLNGTWTEIAAGGRNLYGTSEPIEAADEGTLYIQYNSLDYSVTALWAYIGGGWREIQLGGGSSGGARYTETVLWSGLQTTTGTITLSDSINNYDWIMVEWSPQKDNTELSHKTDIVRVADVDYSTTGQFILDFMAVSSDYSVSTSYHFSSANELTVDEVINSSQFSFHLLKVIGIKWEIQETALIYSEEEREVGVWTDGKPLYQKTLVQSGTVRLTDYVWTTITFSNTIPSNIEYCHAIALYDGCPFDGRIRIEYNRNSGTFAGASPQSGGLDLTGMRLTIQYTKTTDVAGSGTYITTGGYAHHYSTTEQVIGTWIDGKTLYQCTYDLGADTNVSSTAWYASSITITGLASIISCQTTNNSGTYYPLNAYHENGAVRLLACRDGNNATARYVTLQYTKSS